MSSWLLPDYVFATYREVTPEFLKSIGINTVGHVFYVVMIVVKLSHE